MKTKKAAESANSSKAAKLAKTTKAAKILKAAKNSKLVKISKDEKAAKTASPSKSTKLFKRLIIAAGSLLFLVTMASLFFVNFNAGITLLVCVSGFLIIYGSFFERLVRIRWLTYVILAGCVFALAMMISMCVYGIKDNATYREDAVIVLGAGIRGERVSLTLARRLEKAVEYSAKNPEAIVVVSGAQGPQEDITEALAMERYLISRGVPRERIVKEEKATSTYENLMYAKEILDGMVEEPYEIVVITNEFHMFRTSRLAKKLELSATRIHSRTEWYEAPRNYLRECLAICKFILLGR
ncbi:MAG: YdcF family protein [Peptococcaceae bacterium]|nr:YdcF family protein [Peptococcaceae bacterium]